MAAKIGGAALRAAKESNPDIATDGVKAAAKAIEEFDNNISKYKKMVV